jgi:hypothetical protein
MEIIAGTLFWDTMALVGGVLLRALLGGLT